MNKKPIWYMIPAALIPYLALCALAVLFFSTSHPLCQWIMESVFCGNVLFLFAPLLLFCVLAAAIGIACFVISVRKGWDALLLAKTAMIVKLIQIPSYALIFALSIVLAITLFTIPFAVGLFLIDCLTLCLTGLLTVAAACNAVRQGIFKWEELILILLAQLVFCADVAGAIVLYSRLRKRYKAVQ